MKKFLSILICLILILSLTACGASSGSSFDNAAPEEHIMDGMASSPGMSPEAEMPMPNKDQSIPQKSDRKLIKHTQMELQTKDFDTALESIFSAIEELGGYVEYQQITGESLYNSGRSSRYADINARIPVEKLSEAEEKMSSLFNVTNKTSHIDDITDSYFDTDARLNSAKAREARLLELLGQAKTMEDIITIESKLSDVRYEIERLTASINNMDKQVAYSFLNLSLSEVIDYDVAEETFLEKLYSSFKISGKNLARWGQNLLFFIIEDLPVVILQIALWGVVIVIIGLINKKFEIWQKLRKLFGRKDKKN